jgi:hypothetical protein
MGEVEDITAKEVRTQLKKTRKKKCPDDAGVVMELIVAGGEDLEATLAEVLLMSYVADRTSHYIGSFRQSRSYSKKAMRRCQKTTD